MRRVRSSVFATLLRCVIPYGMWVPIAPGYAHLPPHRWTTLYHGCARSSASERSPTQVLPPGTLCPTTSALWLILSSFGNCLNHTILVKFCNICWFLCFSIWLLLCTYGLYPLSNRRTINHWYDMIWYDDTIWYDTIPYHTIPYHTIPYNIGLVANCCLLRPLCL